MADNTQLNLGSGGDVIASDDISGIKYQRVKLALGDDGVNDGDVSAANPIPVVGTVNATLPYGSFDTFGKLVISESHNDIDVQFYRDDPNNILTVTTSAGGTAVKSAGFATFSTSTATTGSVKGVSLDTTHYHSGGEIYAMFAAAFPDGGQATSFQRIGLFDNSNGFYVGYENTNFGFTIRKGSSDTFTAKSSWNVDTLVGGATSRFTRNGAPEAIDLTKLNVFRIRFGWLGAAAVKLEVLSPDDEWVLVHIIRQPNLSDVPHIENADLPITLEATKTGGATNIRMFTTCWGAGIQYSHQDWKNTATLGTTVGNTVNYDIESLSAVTLYVSTSTTGTFDIEGTIDGKNWFRHPYVIDYNSAGQALLVQSSITPVNTSFYKMSVAGLRGLRLRTTSTLGTQITVAFVGVSEAGEFFIGQAPHNIGYQTHWKAGEYSTAQTGVALWTPASGKKVVITDMNITTGGTTAGIVTVWQGSAADTTYTAGNPPTGDPVLFRGEFAPTANAKPGAIKTFSVPFVATTADHIIRVTTSANITVYIQLTGYEI